MQAIIGFVSDFGLDDAWVGVCRAVASARGESPDAVARASTRAAESCFGRAFGAQVVGSVPEHT